MTICKTCGYSSWCDCPKADDKNVNANELINKLKLVRCMAGDGQVLNEAETMLRQQQAEIEALKEVLIKVKELLEQSTEIDFDDMVHIAITSEDECDMRELIEKILSGKDDDDDEDR